jgi:uncharacterized protein (DUF2336 family)
MNIEPSFGLDISVFEAVLDQGSPQARITLARQLAGLLADTDAPAAERQQVIPVVLKLAVDPVRDVREALVFELLFITDLHADVVFSIIADDDDIAIPFLRVTPALTHWHMLAVLRVGDEHRQVTIAKRGDLSAEAAAYIIQSGPLATCLALFENDCVQFDNNDYHVFYNRFGQSAEMVELLLAKKDLPLEIRFLQAKRASNRMHQLMAERGWVAANDAAELVVDAEETAILRILIEATSAELATSIRFLAAKNMLTPSIIIRAASLGEMVVVEWALAHLAGVSPQRAKDMMYGGGLIGVRSLLNKSGLPQSCHGLLRAACEVVCDAQDEGLPLDSGTFGRRLLEALMTRYENMQTAERAKQLEFVGRFAEDRVRTIAKRLKADMVRAA